MNEEEFTPPPQMTVEQHASTDRVRLHFLIDSEQNDDFSDAIQAAFSEIAVDGSECTQVQYRDLITRCIDRAIEVTGYAIAEGTVQ